MLVGGLIVGWVCLTLAGCGSTPRRNPTQRDVATIGAAVSDIVYQCQSVAAGFIAAPDPGSLKHDVNSLLKVDQDVRANATFQVGSAVGIRRKTTLSKEVGLAARNLMNANCAPAEAKRLEPVLGD